MLDLLKNVNIPLRLRKKIKKVMRRPQKGQAFHTRVFGSAYEGVTGNHQDDKIYFFGSHEPATLRLMRGILQWQRMTGRVPVYADVGTNSGQHLVAVAALADRAAGFEPWAAVRTRAQGNLDANQFTHVQLFPYGLAAVDADRDFFPSFNDNQGIGSFLDLEKKTAPVMLRVRRGDDVMREHGFTPTLIKIDTEGLEKEVLAGLRDTLARDRPAVVFEYSAVSRHDFPDGAALAALFPPGYAFFGLAPSREYPRLRPFTPQGRWENILAWPESVVPDGVFIRR